MWLLILKLLKVLKLSPYYFFYALRNIASNFLYTFNIEGCATIFNSTYSHLFILFTSRTLFSNSAAGPGRRFVARPPIVAYF